MVSPKYLNINNNCKPGEYVRVFTVAVFVQDYKKFFPKTSTVKKPKESPNFCTSRKRPTFINFCRDES